MDERKRQILTRFDEAENYDAAADIQRRCAAFLAERIVTDLTETQPTRILEFGCGTGFLTEHLSRDFPNSAILATDLAPTMLARARSRFHGQKNIAFKVMDGERPDATGPFDLIASSLCFQWFENRSKGLERLCRSLAPGGTLMIATLLEGSLKEWRSTCQKTDTPCGVPSYPGAPTLQQEWPSGGRGKWHTANMQDPAPNARIFLRRLQQIGASLPGKGTTPAGIHALRRAMSCFDKEHTSVTYALGIGIFRKDMP